MKKKFLSVLLCAVLALAVLPTGALADHFTVDSGTVRFTRFNGEDQLVSDFTSDKIYEPVGQLQPGDDVTMTVTLFNDHPETVDFYMSTAVLKSMEESENTARTIGGGGYTYELTYEGPGGTQPLYSSDAVGGDGAANGIVGLHQAAEWSDEFGYLDTLSTGQTGHLTLKVSLDGDTQSNNYQDTLARLQMRFATVLTSDEPGRGTSVLTGDNTDMEKYVSISGISGVAVLVLAIYAWWCGRKEKKTEGKNEKV